MTLYYLILFVYCCSHPLFYLYSPHHFCVFINLFSVQLLFQSIVVTAYGARHNLNSSQLSLICSIFPSLNESLHCYYTSARVRDTTQRAGGGVAETWHVRGGNAGLIIHTYCSKRRVGEKYRGETEGDKDKEGGNDPDGEVFQLQWCTLGALPPWGNGCEGSPSWGTRKQQQQKSRGREYSWILY